MPPRKKPGTSANGNKGASAYLLFEEDDNGGLKPLGEQPGRNVNDAVKQYIGANEQPTGKLVVIPKRNLNRVAVKVESVQKVTIG